MKEMPAPLKSMPCPSTEKSLTELKQTGWESEWSFHTRFSDQWNDACDRVKNLNKDGFWEVVLVQGQNEAERKDGVAYLYKKRTNLYEDLRHLHKLADELDVLQKMENNGRGVSCVQSVVSYLRMGQLDEAKRLCNWDHDKIVNYPKLVTYIKNNLFEPGEDHPWSVLERLKS